MKKFSKRIIILASGSPRRYELLHSIGFEVRVKAPLVDESPLKNEKPIEMVLRLAKLKATAIQSYSAGEDFDLSRNPNNIHDLNSTLNSNDLPIIAADTIVCLEDKILGKPKDGVEAKQMLEFLSGKEHEVITGFIVKKGRFERVGTVTTKVSFRTLTESEILHYIASGEPLDKAGAYAIQGRGASLIDRVQGSYTNVMGLPLKEILQTLEEILF